MIEIDTKRKIIKLTRGNTARIVFSAKDEEGTFYVPVAGDKLNFSVAKKPGGTPIFSVENTMVDDEETFWTIVIDEEDTADMRIGDYAYDVDLITTDGTDTIIGETDCIHPTFRLWPDVPPEDEA